MVAQISRHHADYIWRNMPYARALDFRTVWLRQDGQACARPVPDSGPLNRVL